MNDDLLTLTYAQARGMTEAQLRHVFGLVIGDIIADHNIGFLAFPDATRRMSKDDMLAFIAEHPDWFA